MDLKTKSLVKSWLLVLPILGIWHEPVVAQFGPVIACDVDDDGDVDNIDVAVVTACVQGPLMRHDNSVPCVFSDANKDEHIDLRDAADLLNCYSGEGVPAEMACAIRPLDIALTATCAGNPPTPTQSPGTDLHKVVIDAPGAVCNDGSPAVFYIRAASAPEFASRWIIFLEGGGSCANFDSCQERWCGLHPIYTAAKMSSVWAHDAIRGTGILDRSMTPIANANLVFLPYCSSDSWSGRRYAANLSSESSPSLPYSLHFQGHRIVEAAVQLLKNGPVASEDGAEIVPNLSLAGDILFAGESGGANGVRHNLDWFAAQFDPEQTTVRGVVDAGLPAPGEWYVNETIGDLVNAQGQFIQAPQFGPDLYNGFVDESCAAHLEGTPDAWRCTSTPYVALNHLTTPFFARMDLTDSVAIGGAINAGATVSDFAGAVRSLMLALPDIANTATESAAINFTPGVYVPNCGKHIAISNREYFFTATLEGDGGRATTFHEALALWLLGNDVLLVDDHPSTRSTCP